MQIPFSDDPPIPNSLPKLPDLQKVEKRLNYYNKILIVVLGFVTILLAAAAAYFLITNPS